MNSTTNDADVSPGTTHVGRVALRVADVDEVARFYETVVGLRRLDTSAGGTNVDRVTLGAGDTPLLELHARPDLSLRAREETGLFHTAFLFPDRASLADALERVEREWRLDGASDHAVSEALYLTDPEGNGVELYRDRPDEAWPISDDGRVEMVTERLDIDALRAEACGEDGAPDATTVGHVHLEVSSVPDSRAFYVDGVGMTLRQEWSGAAFVASVPAGTSVPTGTSVGYHHHVGLNSWNGRQRPGEGLGLDWFELVVPDAEALDALAARLESRGAGVEQTDDGFRVDDPDGIRVRVRIAE